MTKGKWIVAWIYNGKSFEESFDFRLLAEIKLIQLDAYKITGSIHFR